MLIGAKHFRSLAATSFFVGRFRIRAPYNVAVMALAGRWQGIRGYLRGLWEGSALRAERLWPAARGVGEGRRTKGPSGRRSQFQAGRLAQESRQSLARHRLALAPSFDARSGADVEAFRRVLAVA